MYPNNHIVQCLSFLQIKPCNLFIPVSFSGVEMKWFWNLKIKAEIIYLFVCLFTVLVSYRGDRRREAKSFEEVKDI